MAARIELHSGAGDVVADLFGRGGWVARAAVDRQRKAVTLEVEPADPDARRGRPAPARRPPPRRRLPGAGRVAAPRFEPQGLDQRPVRDPLRDLRPDARRRRDHLVGRRRGRALPVGCDRSAGTTAARSAATSVAGPSSGRRRSTRTTCAEPPPTSGPRRCARPCSTGSRRSRGPRACPTSCSTCTPARQLVGLGAILERIEGDLRAAPVLAALRLAFVHAILPASRLGTGPGRAAALRVSSGHVRPQTATQFRERNPWLAFEDAFRVVRGFIQRLEGGTSGPIQARLGEDLRSLGEGTATTVVALSGPRGLATLRDDPEAYGRTAPTPRVRLVLGQPPMRPSLERHRGRLSRHGLGARSRGRHPPADRGARGRLAPAAVELAGDDLERGARRPRAGHGARRTGHPAGRRQRRVDRRGRARRRDRRLSIAQRATGRCRRSGGSRRRAAPPARAAATGRPDAWQRRPRARARRRRRPGRRAVARPVRPARAGRPDGRSPPRTPPGP